MASRAAIVITVIVVVILLGLFIFVVVWGWEKTNTETTVTTVEPLTSPVGLGYRCRDFTCSPGTACDSLAQVCKLEVGQSCQISDDCLNGAYCSGVCVTAEPGLISGEANAPCPCGPTMDCIGLADGSGLRLCKRLSTQPCTTGDECLSSVCSAGRCTSGKPAGQACSRNSECVTGTTCSIGYCQTTGVVTGERGAACNPDGSPTCNSGLACIGGICIPVTQGVGEACDTSLATCIPPLLCLNGETRATCGGMESNCECSYPYSDESGVYRPNPNSCEQTGLCTSGYTCQGGRCLGIAGMACTFQPECANSCRDGSGGIYVLSFTVQDTITREPVTSTDSSLILYNYDVRTIKVSTGLVPRGAVALTGHSSTTGDSIYYVVVGDIGNPTETGLIDMEGQVRIPGYAEMASIIGSTTTIVGRRFLWATIWSSTDGLVAYEEIVTTITTGELGQTTTLTTNHTLWSYNPSGVGLAPYNETPGSGLPGTQYSGGEVLEIERVSRSTAGDVLISSAGRTYVKPATQSYYTPLVSSIDGTTILTGLGSPSYYYDTNGSGVPDTNLGLPCIGDCPSYVNVSYIADYNQVGSSGLTYLGRLLQFNGDAAGAVFPLLAESPDSYEVSEYSIHSDPTGGLPAGYVAVIATNTANGRTNLFVAPYGLLEVLPGYVNAGTRLLALGTGLYLYAAGICT